MTDDLAFETISTLAPRIRRRDLSSEELVRTVIERTHRLEPTLNSYITFRPDAALERARAVDLEIAQGKYRGPLHGIPFSLKDHFETQGVPTTAGARFLAGNVPKQDAAVARRLKAAGAVLLGKSNMNKFAGGESGDNPDFGKIRNPWNTDYSPGGSSGGAGAQVAAGLVPLSIGSDNGGSIRIPAALCGVVGLKPTFGRISMEGMYPRAYTADHPGPLTRLVEDCAIALQALAGHDRGDTTTIAKPVPDYLASLKKPLTTLRVGVDHKYASVGEPAVLDRFGAALETLIRLGATLHDVTVPAVDEMTTLGYALMPDYSSDTQLFLAHPDEYPAEFRPYAMAALLTPAMAYIKAMQKRRLIQVEYARATKSVDVFACPSYPLRRRPFGEYPRGYRPCLGGEACRH